MKKIPGDIIVLHMRTINDNDMMYVCSDMERKRTFCYFAQLTFILSSKSETSLGSISSIKKLGSFGFLRKYPLAGF